MDRRVYLFRLRIQCLTDGASYFSRRPAVSIRPKRVAVGPPHFLLLCQRADFKVFLLHHVANCQDSFNRIGVGMYSTATFTPENDVPNVVASLVIGKVYLGDRLTSRRAVTGLPVVMHSLPGLRQFTGVVKQFNGEVNHAIPVLEASFGLRSFHGGSELRLDILLDFARTRVEKPLHSTNVLSRAIVVQTRKSTGKKVSNVRRHLAGVNAVSLSSRHSRGLARRLVSVARHTRPGWIPCLWIFLRGQHFPADALHSTTPATTSVAFSFPKVYTRRGSPTQTTRRQHRLDLALGRAPESLFELVLKLHMSGLAVRVSSGPRKLL